MGCSGKIQLTLIAFSNGIETKRRACTLFYIITRELVKGHLFTCFDIVIAQAYLLCMRQKQQKRASSGRFV